MKGKGLLYILIAIILAVGATLGVTLGVQAYQKKKADTVSEDGLVYTIQYLEGEYDQSDSMVFKVVATDEKEVTAIKYTIDNGSEVNCSGTHPDEDDRNKFDTGVEVVSLSNLSAGEHIITFYAYGGRDGATKYKLGSARIFNVKASSNGGNQGGGAEE